MPSPYPAAGDKDTRHIKPWANHGRPGHPLLHVVGLLYCIVMSSVILQYTNIYKQSIRTFGHRRLSRQPMGRFALSAGVERLVLPSFL
jgi:hypothetical protein